MISLRETRNWKHVTLLSTWLLTPTANLSSLTASPDPWWDAHRNQMEFCCSLLWQQHQGLYLQIFVTFSSQTHFPWCSCNGIQILIKCGGSIDKINNRMETTSRLIKTKELISKRMVHYIVFATCLDSLLEPQWHTCPGHSQDLLVIKSHPDSMEVPVIRKEIKIK